MKARDRYNVILITIIIILGAFVRLIFFDIESYDAITCLIPWYNKIKELGGIKAISTQVGNYNFTYQLIISILTYIPIKHLHGYKIVSCIFDLLLSINLARLADDVKTKEKIFVLTWMSPLVILNSSWWGQCDSIYSFFCIMSLISLVRNREDRAFIYLGLAITFKLQAVFIIPLLITYICIKDKCKSIIKFLYTLATIAIMILPNIIAGRKATDFLNIYIKQIGQYKSISLNYPSALQLISYNIKCSHTAYKIIVTGFTGILILILMGITIKHIDKFNKTMLINTMFITVYTAVIFLPSMHERYGYIYEILLIPMILMNKNIETIISALLIYYCTLRTYLFFLLDIEYNKDFLSLINIVAYTICLIYYMEQLKMHPVNTDKEACKKHYT